MYRSFVQYLVENPLLLLFLVGSLGYGAGKIKIGGFSLGISAVLFVGIAFGSLDPNLKLPEFVYLLGLIVFVYTIGLSSGPGFRRSLSRRGLRDNAFAAGILLLGGFFTVTAHYLLKLEPRLSAGLYCGSFTNTPALAAVLETVKGLVSGDVLETALAESVFSYSVVYPFGVIGVMLAIYLMQSVWRIDYQAEAKSLRELGDSGKKLVSATARVLNSDISIKPAVDHVRDNNFDIILSRIKREGHTTVINPQSVLQPGDEISFIGGEEDVKAFIKFVGEESEDELDLDRHEIDYRRIFVSSPEVAERELRDLHLPQRFGGIITRVRRGDVEFMPKRNTALELGDRVRVVAPRKIMPEITKYFGDSVKAISEIDIRSFSFGITLGLLLGNIAIPLPGGTEFKLGFAGGPLVMGLILGMIGRTGNIVWQLPYGANMVLRQVGLVLFLSGVGVRSGYAFVSAFNKGGGAELFFAGAAITFTTVIIALWTGHKLLKIPMGILIGMISGIHTQPAVLGFANEQSKHELANIGYATVYPVSTVTKILIAQMLLYL